MMDGKDAKRSTPISPKVHAREIRGISHVRPGGLMRHRRRKRDESMPNGASESSRFPCGEPPRHIMGCRGLGRLRAEAWHAGRAQGLRGPLPAPGQLPP